MIDQAGIYYRIPIACINDPFNYNKNTQLEELLAKKIPNEAMLKVSPPVSAIVSLHCVGQGQVYGWRPPDDHFEPIDRRGR